MAFTVNGLDNLNSSENEKDKKEDKVLFKRYSDL